MNPENTLKQRKEINGNTLLLLITIVLFVVLYAGGCIAYSGKGFTNLQTFLNILISNAGLICVACGMTCVMLAGGIGSAGLYASGLWNGKLGHRRAGYVFDCFSCGPGFWLCPGILCRLLANSAIYCYNGWDVLCTWHDSSDFYGSAFHYG